MLAARRLEVPPKIPSQDLAQRLQDELDKLRSRTRNAERDCESLRRQLASSRTRVANDDSHELAERLMEMQEALEAARDRATDAEMECEALRKQQQGQAIRASSEEAGDDDPDLLEKVTLLQEQLDLTRDRATDAEMECESLRKQLASSGTRQADEDVMGDSDELAERLMEMQEALEAARDRATDAEMECEALRKQQQGQAMRASSEEAGDDDPDLLEKVTLLQEQLDLTRDRATDAEMECESLRKQLASSGTRQADEDAMGDSDELAERLMEMQEALEAARDRATDAEMECEALRKQQQGQAMRASSEEAGDDNPDLLEKVALLQEQLDLTRDRATNAEMECESFRKQLASSGTRQADEDAMGDSDELAERLMEMQEALEAARDRATDAEMECEALRKQQQGQAMRASSEEAGDDDPDLLEKVTLLQEQLDLTRDRATDAEMECESLRQQLASAGTRQADEDAKGDPDELAERVMEMQEALEAARDRATDAEMECETLRSKLHHAATVQLTENVVLQDGKTSRELELERQIADLMSDLHCMKHSKA